MSNPKEQCFMHVATYRLADLRAAETSGSADLGPDVFEAEITPALANAVSSRLTDVCTLNGWRLIDVHVFADRIEAFLMGKEADGETGEAVAAALDGEVYGSHPGEEPRRGIAQSSPPSVVQS